MTKSESKTTRILEKAEGVSAREIVAIIEAAAFMAVALNEAKCVISHYRSMIPWSEPDAEMDAKIEQSLSAWTKAQSGNKGKDNG